MSARLILIFILFTFVKANFLTQEEREWLKSYSAPFVVGVTQIPNQVLKKGNKLEGFSIDIFNLLSKKIDHKITFKYFNSWKEVINAAKKGDIDIIFLAQKTPKRLEFLDFTKTVLTQTNNLITRYKSGIKSLKDVKTLAIVKDSAIESYIRSFYPDKKIIPTKNELESLRCVEEKRCDATISEPVRAGFYIKKLNFKNLIISQDIGYNYYLAIATIKSKPYINVILSKALDSIDENQLKTIKAKWGYIKEKVLDIKTLLFLVSILIIITLIAIYLIRINKKLKTALNEKKEAIKRVEALKKAKEDTMKETISTIAHHWRQPLNNIALLTDLLNLKFLQKKLDENFMEYFSKKIKENIQHMSKTIELFNAINKNEKKVAFKIKEAIKSHIQTLAQKYDFKVIIEGEEVEIKSYLSSLQQIVTEFVKNSVEFVKEDEKIIFINISQKDDKIIIDIKDNGKIDKEIVDRIFEPYFSTKSEKNDVGLGLFKVKSIVYYKLRGNIELIDYNNAHFRITFPKEVE